MPDHPTFLSLAPALFGLLGTLIGGAITVGAQYVGQYTDRRERRKPLAAALAAEISAFVELMGAEPWVRLVEGELAALRTGVDRKVRIELHAFQVDRMPLPFFERSTLDFGILGADLCRELARLRVYVDALRALLDKAGSGAIDGLSPPDRAIILERLLAVWSTAQALGCRLAETLEVISHPGSD